MTIKGVILDWAGTTVDYGCFAPVAVFIEVFANKGIEITMDEARKPMGMLKIDHLRTLCEMERIAGLWEAKYGRIPNDADVNEMYTDFERILFSILANYAEPIPGVIELMERLRKQGIKIGSTTGYTFEMMKVVATEANKRGYAPDLLITPDDVPAGRPYPWMIYENAIRLDLYPMKHMVKAGDTISDIQEGVNAGVWTVGVLKGSSELGMTEAEVAACPPQELSEKLLAVELKYRAAGAHYVIDSIGELDTIIGLINARLEQGDKP
ncbi:phosphonoacetaldehyde hydrolase [Paenibacillus sp. CF384]|uniref:phosphonoacetaldehyde hydrolase n=1 Tax=Paenibacillus sp. CF384 TaxID=1884382 RepID=UPI00089D95F9|nr:phosphonoacetaldehyde hydrolase [Paenibacillus sp. CF384]SDW43242.1 phosphonoacetaldehyde hydrolase [Paenibacillus sp. CF384]